MVDVPFPSTNSPGSAPGEGAGRLVNCYAYKDGDTLRWRPLPGLTPFASPPVGEVRGMLLNAGLLIAVVGRAVVQVDGSGAVTVLEEQVAGDGPVTIARNNNAIPAVAIVSSNGVYELDGGVVERYSTGVETDTFEPFQMPQPNSISFLDGYLLFTFPDGTIAASNLNSTDVAALSTTKAEAKADGLVRGVVSGSQFFAMGTETIEVFQDAATSPFPLARSVVIPLGLLGPWAVAGFEDGWAEAVIFVAQDRSVRMLDDYTPTRVSSEDLERLIGAVTDPTTLRAAVYTFGGNSIWSLSSPNWTWDFNVTTRSWHERESFGLTRWRGGPTVNAFGGWLVADIETGALLTVDVKARTEGGDPLVWGLDSGPVKQFPARLQIPTAAFDFVIGQAAANGGTPDAMLSWSHDGGAKWAQPVTRSLGNQGHSVGRVTVNRIGLSSHHGTRFRFRVSDPAYTSFAGARIDATNRK